MWSDAKRVEVNRNWQVDSICVFRRDSCECVVRERKKKRKKNRSAISGQGDGLLVTPNGKLSFRGRFQTEQHKKIGLISLTPPLQLREHLVAFALPSGRV